MNTSKASDHRVARFFVALSFCVGASMLVQAEDVVPSKVQSDEQISVWVDDASLPLFIEQLASITGREAAIQGELPGLVSGRFNGSMADTLVTVGKQFKVLFDLDDGTLGAVPYSDRSSATIALGETVLDAQTKATLVDGLIEGNRVDIREGEVVVSGHPSFVSRLAKILISVVVRSAPEPGKAEQFSALTVVDMLSTEEPGSAETSDGSDSAEPKPVLDAAAQAILDEAAREIEAAGQLKAATVSRSAPREIRWVTDIPGYETF